MSYCVQSVKYLKATSNELFLLFLSHFKYRFRLHAAIIIFMSRIQNSYSLLEKEKGEIVLYQPDDNVRLERRMER